MDEQKRESTRRDSERRNEHRRISHRRKSNTPVDIENRGEFDKRIDYQRKGNRRLGERRH